jgi:hypothetical protein
MTSSLTSLAGLLGLSFASGVNLYAAVLVVGLGIRYQLLSGLPAELEPLAHPAVLITAAVMYGAEFFADKIPFVSAIWDSVHTFVRPLGAVVLALTATQGMGPLEQTVVALTGGAVALTSHATKMGVRLLAHGTGEPVTQAAMSVGEDIFAVSLVMLAAQYPYVAMTIVIVMLVAIAVLLPLIWKALRAVFTRMRNFFTGESNRQQNLA